MNHPFLLFTLQQHAAMLSFCGGALVVCIVLFLIFTSKKEEDNHEAHDRVYKVRGVYFWVLTGALAVLLIVSFRFVPYPSNQAKPDMDVTVVGMQWFWKMAPGDSKDTPAAFNGQNEIDLPVNKTVRFIVTSQDVNHDFAIYDSDGTLVAQTMAMPEYKNQLSYKFSKPGDYEVLCLEYCGMPHAFMTGTIHVK